MGFFSGLDTEKYDRQYSDRHLVERIAQYFRNQNRRLILLGAAILITWLLGTAGFGAALLSRAGVRENFAGRIIPPEALTDEYLWATPQFGVPAVRRPGVTRSPSGGP